MPFGGPLLLLRLLLLLLLLRLLLRLPLLLLLLTTYHERGACVLPRSHRVQIEAKECPLLLIGQ